MNMQWRIQLLGELRAVQGDRVVTRFSRGAARKLLGFLAYNLDRAHPRDILIDLLWPEADPDSARHSLATVIGCLRHLLEPPVAPAGTVLLADRGLVQLNPAAVTTDVAEFNANLKAAARATTDAERLHLLSEAVEVYRGELLPGFYEEWVETERQRLAECFYQAIREVILHWEAAGELKRAIQLAYQAVSADRLREEAHAELIRLYAAAGHLNTAWRLYRELKGLLRKELGVPPSPATRALADSIRAQLSDPDPSPDVPAPPPPPGPPIGTVTFLLTEIDGATALCARAGKAFKKALARHHALLREEFQQHKGYKAKESAGGFQVAFASAGDAVKCAVAAQRTLMAGVWPKAVGPLRVRMALHTGDMELEGGEYVGVALYQVAQMVLAAHGGQILCSEITAHLLRRDATWSLEPGIRLVNLGVYRLPDALSQERLFQVNYPGMEHAEFPPLRVDRGYNSNLPLPLTRFFGRELEIERLHAMLLPDDRADETNWPSPNPGCRLVTLTGPGGSGKTRLAQVVANRLLEPFRGAVWFLPLTGITDPNRILDVVRDELQLPRPPNVEPLEQVVVALSPQPALLVLDNFEHLVPEGSRIVRTLLGRVPTLTCLVTSRRKLNLVGERQYPVPPLPTPERAGTPEELACCESVQLFVDRTQAVRPDFQITEANAAAVAALCRRLEGLPLALELAAARGQALTPAQILTHLESRISFLEVRQWDVEEKQRSMRATLDWSYQLLSPELQRFFARLCVFRNGWTLEAAEAMGVEGEPALLGPALDYLEQLRECSLVEVAEILDQIRYFLPETLREYGWERLSEGGEAETVRRRHRDWYLALAEPLEAQIHGPEQHRCLERLETEHENLRAALEWCRIEADAEKWQRLAGALWKFWYAHGYFREGRQWMEGALAAGRGGPEARLKALLGAGTLAFFMGDYEAAASFAAECLASSQDQGNARFEAQSLNLIGWVALDRGEYGQAATLFNGCLACARKAGDRFSIALSLHSLGCLALREDQPAEATTFFEESLALFRQIDDAWGISLPLESLGDLALRAGDYERVKALYEEVLERSRSQGHTARIAGSLLNLGHVARHQGDYARAAQLLKESLAAQRSIGGKPEIAECLEELAITASVQQEWTRAARLFGAAEALRDALGTAFQPSNRADHDQWVAAVRSQLDDPAFTAAWAEGRAMTLEQAIDYALDT